MALLLVEAADCRLLVLIQSSGLTLLLLERVLTAGIASGEEDARRRRDVSRVLDNLLAKPLSQSHRSMLFG